MFAPANYYLFYKELCLLPARKKVALWTFEVQFRSELCCNMVCDFGPELKMARFNNMQLQQNRPDFDKEKVLELFSIELCQQQRCTRGGPVL